MAADTPKIYDKIWVTDFFHGFEHLNFQFRPVNSTFNPRDPDYQESLAVLFLLCMAVCIIVWLGDIIYFICQCCTKQPVPYRVIKHDKPRTQRVFAYILLLLGLALCGVGFSVNEDMHHGIEGVAKAVENVNTTVTSASSNILYLDDLADDVGVRLADDLEASVSTITDPTLRTKLQEWVETMRSQAEIVKTSVDHVGEIRDVQKSLSDAHHTVNVVEFYRWMATLAMLIVYCIQFVLTLGGLIKGSKSLLIFNAMFGIGLALLFWGLVGVYLSSSVASGDYCNNPNGFLVQELALSDLKMNAAHIREYMQCTEPTLPYQTVILEAQTSVTKASTTINEFAQAVKPLEIPGLNDTIFEVETDLQMALGNLSSLLNSVGRCTVVHNYYIDAVTSMCVDTISSEALLLLISIVLVLTCSINIILVSCVWRQYNRRSAVQYLSNDESDPFLPRPPPYESDYGAIGRTASPRWSERGVLQTHYPAPGNEDQVMILRYQQYPARDESPPPAYHSGQFSSQHVEAALSSNHGRPRNE